MKGQATADDELATLQRALDRVRERKRPRQSEEADGADTGSPSGGDDGLLSALPNLQIEEAQRKDD